MGVNGGIENQSGKRSFSVMVIFGQNERESIINYFKNRDIQIFLSSTDDLGIESMNFYINEGDVIEPTNS